MGKWMLEENCVRGKKQGKAHVSSNSRVLLQHLLRGCLKDREGCHRVSAGLKDITLASKNVIFSVTYNLLSVGNGFQTPVLSFLLPCRV